MNENSASDFLKAFYYEYLSLDSNISKTAEKHGITNAVCFRMVADGKALAEKK